MLQHGRCFMAGLPKGPGHSECWVQPLSLLELGSFSFWLSRAVMGLTQGRLRGGRSEPGWVMQVLGWVRCKRLLHPVETPSSVSVSLLPSRWALQSASFWLFWAGLLFIIDILQIVSNYLSLFSLQKNVLNLNLLAKYFCFSGKLMFFNFFCISHFSINKPFHELLRSLRLQPYRAFVPNVIFIPFTDEIRLVQLKCGTVGWQPPSISHVHVLSYGLTSDIQGIYI